MNIEKIFYIILSTVLVTVFILFTFIFSPNEFNSGSSSKQKTIYFVDHISFAHQKVIDLFNEKNKGFIKVETINLSFEKFSTNERKELLARYLRSKNNRIDIFSVDQIWVPRFARWGVPIQKYLDSTEINTLIPNALETCYYKGSLVAVPLYIDIALMIYRDDLLKKFSDYVQLKQLIDQSITWEKFIELSKRFNINTNPFYIFQADDYEGLICSFTELMANQGIAFVEANGKINLDTPQGQKSLQLLVDLVNKYNAAPKSVTYLKENESYRLFAKSNGVFIRSWSSMFDDEIEFISKETKSNLRMAPMPHFEGTKPGSVYGGWNLLISKFSERIPEVIKFTKFLLSEESQKIMFEEGGYLPTIKTLYEDKKYVQHHPELNFIKKLYKTGVHRPFLERYTNVSDVLSFYINKAIKQELTVDEALKEATKKINEKAILIK
ncbi:MAG: extracellular solute-binding protein [Ignavibacteriota bacterium]